MIGLKPTSLRKAKEDTRFSKSLCITAPPTFITANLYSSEENLSKYFLISFSLLIPLRSLRIEFLVKYLFILLFIDVCPGSGTLS